MRRFSGFLALIVLVAIGLGVVYYDRLWPDARRTEMPSAITAGAPEGPGDEASENTPTVDTAAAPSSDGGKAAVVETPSSGQASADAMASAEPQHDVEPPVALETPAASANQTPGAPPAEDGVVAGAPSAVSPEVASGAVTPDVAETPDAAVAPEATAQAPEVTTPEVATAPESSPAPESPVAEAAAEPAASPDEPAATVTAPDAAETETEVAIAPEVQSDTRDGATPPASESSGRDSMMQASPGPETAPAVSETEMAAIDPSAVIEPPQPTAAPEPLAPGTDSETAAVVPTFDVVRVESTGDAVVAGVAAPGATVELVDGASTVATAVASGTGDWAMALEEPLPPGQHDLSIRTTSKDDATVTLSDQRVAVLIPETAAEEPLVVLNTPDAPSAILQVPAAPEPPAVDVAAAEPPGSADAAASPSPVGEGAVPPAAAVAEASEPPPTAPEAAAPEAGTDVATAEPVTAEPPAAETDAAAAPATSEPAEPGSAAPAEPEVAALPPEAAPAEGPSAPAVSEVVAPEATTEPGSSPPDAAPEVAVAEPEPPVAPEPEPEPVVTPVVAVTAVEAETSGALFIAGTAITPEDVRVYVDDVLLGEVTPSPSGTWLLEVKRELPAGTYNVRADQVEPGAGTVLARAEVPFEREVEVAILRPVAEAGSATGAEATGTMAGPTTLIIKRSDNLWRISRELYGKGIRWSTIYQANKDQIRNPRWIYPGQVFILPQGDTEWPEEKDAAAN